MPSTPNLAQLQGAAQESPSGRGRNRALRMLLRMLNLEVKTRQAQRHEQMLRWTFGAWHVQVKMKHQAKGALTAEEATAVQTAFARAAGSGGEILSESGLFWCLTDLGLTGATVLQRREVWRQVALSFGHPEPNEEAEGSDLLEEERLQVKKVPEGSGISQQELVLSVIPAVRHAIQELVEEDFDARRQRLCLGRGEVEVPDLDALVPMEQCMQVARLMGVDIRMFARKIREKAKEGQDHGCRPDEENPSNLLLSKEFAAAAIVRCHAEVAAALRREEVALKQELCSTDPKMVVGRPYLLEIRTRFLGYCELPEYARKERGGVMLNQAGARRLLQETGLLPSTGELFSPYVESEFSLEAKQVHSRFSLSRLLRFLDSQRAAALELAQQEVESAFVLHSRRSTTLSAATAAQALTHLRLCPMRREDQGELMSLLMEAAGLTRHGRIGLEAFQVLCIQARDRLALLRFEAGVDVGASMVLSEKQIFSLWEEFHALEEFNPTSQDASAFRPLASATHSAAAAKAEEGDSDELEVQLAPTTPAHSTRPTLVGDFMYYVATNGRPSPVHIMARSHCARLAATWTSGVFRRALRLLRLPSDYVLSLQSHQLAPVLAEYLGVSLETAEDAGRESPAAQIGESLQVGTPEELYSKAQARGFSLAQALGWEVRSEGDAHSLWGSLGEGLRGG